VRLVKVWDETHDTKTFRFGAPPQGLPDFAPGQFYAVEIPTKEGGSVRRSYSVASSPLEREHFDLTVKFLEGGAGTSALFHHLAVGDAVRASGPFGEFTLDESAPAIFIAGGVGVTPIMSMLRTLDARRPGHRALLLYSNRERRDVVYEKELREIEARNPAFEFHYLLTREAGDVAEPWIRKGRLDSAFVGRVCAARLDHVAYLCGAVPMMEELGRALIAAGLTPSRIRTEAFLGTSPTF
jgi:ferredoxin-NADP reductase